MKGDIVRSDAKGSLLECSICGKERWYSPSRLKRLKGPHCLEHSVRNNHQHISLEQAFWAQVQKTDGCWLWVGYINPKGYGNITRKHIRVHRLSWELANGPIPEGLNVLHQCDNPICVRLSHLFLGTQNDNVQDMVAKGRNHSGITLGEAHPSHKLTENQVLEIRATLYAGGNVIALAKQYGVTRNHIYEIKWGRAWKHLLGG